MLIQKRAAVGRLGVFLAQHRILRGRKQSLPLGLGFGDFKIPGKARTAPGDQADGGKSGVFQNAASIHDTLTLP